MRKATTKEQTELARRAKTSRAYLYVLSGAQGRHAREPRPGLAARLERASIVMRTRNPKLPVLTRMELNTDCRNCEYAKTCITRQEMEQL